MAGVTGSTADDVTVVTVTHGRLDSLRRAVASVLGQDHRGLVEHLVIIDEDAGAREALSQQARPPSRPLRIHDAGPVADRRDGDRSFVYPHLARLLNLGISLATTSWIAFLDDDNEFESGHLSSLVELASTTGSRAVHSGRALVWPDGSPYLDRILPSAPTREEGRRLYELLCNRGVWRRGTNIILDRVDSLLATAPANSTVMGDDDPVFLVDQNLWLVARELLVAVPVPQEFTPADIDAHACPDDKMLEALVAAGIDIRSSGQATVRYSVGGISSGDHMSDRSVHRSN